MISSVDFDTRTPYITVCLIYLVLIIFIKAVIFCFRKKTTTLTNDLTQ
ncbi:hypothetical Protein pso3_02220 [Candidatus Phytoplasma solani]